VKARLDALARDGMVTARPRGDLTLYTYTPECVQAGAWEEATLAARGLVLRDDGEIVARPWPKFFHLGERPETRADRLPAEVPEMAEKLDGSLVVVFRDRDRWRAITKGSWDSAQAAWAQAWLDRTPRPFEPGWTYLFELVAPWNRIVLRYPSEDMVLLGAVRNGDGRDIPYGEVPPVAARLGVTAVRSWRRPLDAVDLGDASVREAEGFVVRYANGLRLKMKFAAYVELHRIVTGLTVKVIWERLRRGEESLPDDVPDELMAWFRERKAAILGVRDALRARIDAAWEATDRARPRGEIAREWASLPAPVKAALFQRLDGESCEDLLWKAARPTKPEAYFGRGE
jgi:RNA ligase